MKPAKSYLIFIPALIILSLLIIGGYFWIRQKTTAQKLNQVEKDWKYIMEGFIAYGIDRCNVYFPPDTAPRRLINQSFPLTFELSPEFIKKAPVGVEKEPVSYWEPLTTPVAYLKSIPLDPFNSGQMYGYTCWNLQDKTCVIAILYSPGPNRKEDIELPMLREKINKYFVQRRGYYSMEPEDKAIVRDYVIPHLYDPNNGINSRGDLIWFITPYYNEDLFGWRRENWQNFPKLDLPVYLPPTSQYIQNDWEEKSYLPSPQSIAEKMNQRSSIIIPGEMVNPFLQMNILQDVGFNKPYKINYKALQPLQNILGPYFSDFFKHPRILTKQEEKQLMKWLHQSPQWWNAIESKKEAGWIDYVSISYLFNILPIYGKSHILLSAQEATHRKYNKAQERINLLRNNLKEIQLQLPESPYWYQERVLSELDRLCTEMDQTIRDTSERKNNTQVRNTS